MGGFTILHLLVLIFAIAAFIMPTWMNHITLRAGKHTTRLNTQYTFIALSVITAIGSFIYVVRVEALYGQGVDKIC